MKVMTCDGCGDDILPSEPWKPQNREVYCLVCNKYFEDFKKAMRPEWDRIDGLKKEAEMKVRKEIFWKKKQEWKKNNPHLVNQPYTREEKVQNEVENALGGNGDGS